MTDKDTCLFKDVVYVVKAGGEDYFNLWRHFSHESDKRLYPSISIHWEEVSRGFSRKIGTVAKRPICIEGRYAILNGKRVMFYDGTSQLVDWKMIDQWMENYLRKCMGWCDTPETYRHCNAANFHQCFETICVK